MLPTKKQTQWENRIKEFGMTYVQYEAKYLKKKKKKKGNKNSSDEIQLQVSQDKVDEQHQDD